VRKFGVLIIVIGAVFIGASMYVKGQVNDGKAQVKEAQEKVDKGQGLFSLTPESEEVGSALSKPVQNKIDAGQLEIDKYETIAAWLLVGGLVLAAAGLGSLVIHGRK
jgi:hypothetical protein